MALSLQQSLVKQLIDGTAFAMAQQDVRYYLNGLYFEVLGGRLRVVATDGHRLALATGPDRVEAADTGVIIPRKGVLELSRLLEGDAPLELSIGAIIYGLPTSSLPSLPSWLMASSRIMSA